MEVRSRVFAIAGFVLSVLAKVFVIASFAAPFWVVTEKSVSPSGFERMGLWESCFDNYYPIYRPITSKRYHGCWAVFSFEMRDLTDYFYPSWMRAVQGMVTISLLLAVVCVVINIIYFIRCCPGNKEHIFVLISSILNFIAAFFLMISTIMFGVKAKTDRDWLPQPDSLTLSWAFGFGILAGILCLMSAMCMMTEFYRLRLQNKYDHSDSGRPSRQNTRYAAPPPRYEMATKHRY